MNRLIAAALSAALFLCLAACGAPTSPDGPGAATAPPGESPAPVTVTMFGYTSNIHTGIYTNLQAAISQEYPHITLEYEEFPTGAGPYTDELTRRIAHGREADLFMTANTALCGTDMVLDLTQEEFVGRYGVSILQEISGDGLVWMLPGIGSVMCYVYNTEHFPTPPQTLTELEEMTAALTESGVHSFIVPYEQSQPLMIQALAASYLASPSGQLWLKDYNEGKATMAGNAEMEAVWARAQRMIESGVLIPEDMVFAESRRLSQIIDRIGAMSTISSGIASTYIYRDGPSSALTLMPFLGETPENKNAFCNPTCYYAASARLGEAGNEAKRAAAMQVLEVISTEEGQNILRGTTPLANSYLQDVSFTLDDQYTQVSQALQAGAYGPAPAFDRGVESVIGAVFGKILTGEMTAEEAIAACDQANRTYLEAPVEPVVPQTIGTAAEEFPWTYTTSRRQELAVTNFVVDSMRAAAGTEIALELGTAIRGEFFQGDITDGDINSVVRVDKKLYTAQVTGQQIWDIIEQGVLIVDSSWFMVVSGLQYNYRPSVGETAGALLTLTLADGTPVEMDKTYTVAASDNQILEFQGLYNFFGSPAEELPVTLREAVTQSIQRQGEITPVLEGRITLVP